jgi:Mga helix-turn-helix domain.
METFLGKRDGLKLQILRYIDYKNEQIFLLKQVSSDLQLSESLLRTLLEELFQEFSEEKMIELKIWQNQFSFRKDRKYHTSYFFSLFLRRSIYYRFLVDIYFEKYISIEKYAQQLYLSPATLSRRWKEFKDHLGQLSIQVKKRNNLFYLAGEEEVIRYVYFKLFFVAQDYPIDSELELLLNQGKLKQTNLKMTQLALENLRLMVTIALHRVGKKNLIQKEVSYFSIPRKIYHEENMDQLLQQIFANYNIHLAEQEIKKEVAFLYFFLTTSIVMPSEVIQQTSTVLSPTLFGEQTFILANHLVYQIVEEMQLTISPEEYFYLLANFYLAIRKKAVFKTIVGLHSFTDLKKMNQLIQEYPILSESSLNEALDVKDIFLIVYPFLASKEQPLKILVTSELGGNHQQFLQNKVRFRVNYPIEFVDSKAEQPQLLIADYFMRETKIPCLYISSFPSEHDYQLLKQAIIQMIQKLNLKQIKSEPFIDH